ncbi:MAG TPA: formate--tetrahydrofolate ligase, partial [Candidatus Rifleibacterium sp.]|nr:formate--tetrahydrofolate ligase [Candidatus Rifleibacterium sp.]
MKKSSTKPDIKNNEEIRLIEEVGAELGLLPEEIEPYGRYKAKISFSTRRRLADKPDGKLILVTAM